MANSLGLSGTQGRADLIDPDHLRLNAAHHHFFKFSMKRMKILLQMFVKIILKLSK